MTPEKANTIRTSVIAGALIVAVVLIALYSFGGDSSHSGSAYFYDLNTSKVFVAPGTGFAPIETPSGPHDGQPAGVRVYIFSCKPCKSFAGMTLDEVRAKGGTPVWFEVYTPEAKKLLEGGDKRPEVMLEGVLMRAVDSEKWVSSNSRDAVALRAKVHEICPEGQPATACTP